MVDDAYKTYLKKQYGLSDIAVNIAVSRGICDEKAAHLYFDGTVRDLSSPYDLPSMAEGVARITNAVKNNEKILIFGDYDCDGIGAVAILYKTLKYMGADVDYFIPIRKTDGYGIKWESLSRAYEQFKPTLIVSVDCGISSYSEIARAKTEFLVDFVITDHHSLPEIVPDAIVINPHLNDGQELCGAGVAFMLSIALIGAEKACQYIDICALSTIADLVPLVGDNRIIVKAGLEKLNSRKVSLGLKDLIAVSGIKVEQHIDSYDVAFKLVPRLNAAGRLDSAERSLKLLITDDPFLSAVIANELDSNNKIRQQLCEEIYQSALSRLSEYDLASVGHILLFDPTWDAGVLGIAASRLVESFGLPTILLTEKDGKLSGSGRSVAGINMFEMLSDAKHLLLGFGGHAMAAGLQLEQQNLSALSIVMSEFVDKCVEGRVNSCGYDAELSPTDVTVALAKELKKFEPFGMANKKPTFLLSPVPHFSRIKDYNHISARMGSASEAVAFSQGKNLSVFNGYTKSLVVKIEYEVFRNIEKAKCYFVSRGEVDCNLSDDFLSAQYLGLCVPRRISTTVKYKRKFTEKSGNLIVTFSPSNYTAFLAEHSDYVGYVAIRDDLSVGNAIVLAPSASFGFGYYSTITFLDAVPQAFCRFLDGTTATRVICKNQKYKRFLPNDITKESVENVYNLFNEYLVGKKFSTFSELFDVIMYNNINVKPTFVQFVATFAAATELSAISFDQNGCIVMLDLAPDFSTSKVMETVGYVG